MRQVQALEKSEVKNGTNVKNKKNAKRIAIQVLAIKGLVQKLKLTDAMVAKWKSLYKKEQMKKRNPTQTLQLKELRASSKITNEN